MNDAFFQPLDGLVATSPHTYPCSEFSDHDWLLLGIERVESGRVFLQGHNPRFDCQPTRANYFVSLQSEHRRDLARDVNQRLIAAADLPDRLAAIPELARHECFALDGYWPQAAAMIRATKAARWR